MAELDQSPRALGPDLQARLPQRQLILFFLPIFASQIILPFQAGYLGVPRQPLVSSVPWDGLYTCAKSREPVL